MGLVDILRRMLYTFIAIWSLSGIMVCILSFLFGWQMFPVRDIYGLLFIATLCSMSYIVFYSKKEIARRQFIVRMVLQFIIIVAIIFPTANVLGWFSHNGILMSIAIITTIIVTYVAVVSWEIYTVWRLAVNLNKRLKERGKG